MTPSTTFQWPLSPSGSFQPAKSFPLNSVTKPDPDPEELGASDAQDTRPARNSPSVRRFMIILPRGSRCRLHLFRPATAFRSLLLHRIPGQVSGRLVVIIGRLEEGSDEDDAGPRPGTDGGPVGWADDARGELLQGRAPRPEDELLEVPHGKGRQGRRRPLELRRNEERRQRRTGVRRRGPR